MARIKPKVKKQELTMDEAAQLRAGMQSPFWQILKRNIEENVEYLTKVILDDDDLSEEITISRRDLYRKLLRYQKNIIQMPEKLIGKIETPQNEMPEKDPYYNNWDDLVKSANARNAN